MSLSVWAISGVPALHRPLPRRRGDGGRTLAQASVIRPLVDIPVALAGRHKRIKIDFERARSTRSNCGTQSDGWPLRADQVIAHVLEVAVAADCTSRQQIIDRDAIGLLTSHGQSAAQVEPYCSRSSAPGASHLGAELRHGP